MNLSEIIDYAMSEMFEVLLRCLSCISFIALLIAMMITIAEHKKEALKKAPLYLYALGAFSMLFTMIYVI